jgi:hypothetical protein
MYPQQLKLFKDPAEPDSTKMTVSDRIWIRDIIFKVSHVHEKKTSNSSIQTKTLCIMLHFTVTMLTGTARYLLYCIVQYILYLEWLCSLSFRTKILSNTIITVTFCSGLHSPKLKVLSTFNYLPSVLFCALASLLASAYKG